MSVDFALVMDVLPDDKDRAKDLAVWHQVVCNVCASTFYSMLFIMLSGFNAYISVVCCSSGYFRARNLIYLPACLPSCLFAVYLY